MTEIYFAGRSLSSFGARLRQSYTVSGSPITPTIRQGKNDSRFFLLDREIGLLTVTLPLDFYGQSVRDIARNMAELRGLCRDLVEADLGDGFRYRLCLTAVGETEWTGDVLCSQTLTLQGMRLGEKITVSSDGGSILRLYNPATWEKTACRLTLSGFRTTSSKCFVHLRQDGDSYLTWQLTSDESYNGGTLILDGMEKVNSYAGGGLPSGTMQWTEYPWLKPGESHLIVAGAEVSGVKVEWEPAYV